MTYQPGRLALLQMGSQTSPGQYTNVGGLRNVDVSIDAGPVDATTKNDDGFQTMLAAGGTWKMTVTGQGLFDDSASLKQLLAFGNVTQAAFPARVAFANGDTWTGNWVVRTLKRTGSYQDAESYDITIESSGAMVFNGGA